MKHGAGNISPSPRPRARGIALVAVLAVLTVLALLAALFAVNMRMEQRMSRSTLDAAQRQLLLLSASEHARCLLAFDGNDYDSYDDTWGAAPVAGAANAPDDADARGSAQGGNWHRVRAGTGELVGRYQLAVHDESGKVNVNAANLRTRKDESLPAWQKAVGTSRIALNSDKGDGTALSLGAAKKLLRWRYGKNRRPGRARFDDNDNAMLFAQDGIDNDADGIVDEVDEGIDEPGEYTHSSSRGDDQAFDSIDEVSGVLGLSPRARRGLMSRVTVHSLEAESRAYKPRNVNSSTPRAMFRSFKDAKLHTQYEESDLRALACNIVDYADENHALGTLGNTYGVEAVCFNEILANDGTVIAPVQAYDDNIELGEKRVPRAGAPFSPLRSSYNMSKDRENPSIVMYNRNRVAAREWFVFDKARFLSSLEGATARIRLDERDLNIRLAGEDSPAARRRMLDAYNRASGGTWPVDLFRNGYIDFPYDDEDFLDDETHFPGVERKHMYVGAARFKIVRSGPRPGEFEIETKGYDTLPVGNCRSYEFDPDHYKKAAYTRHLHSFTNAHCHLISWQYFDISGDWTPRANISEQWIFPGELPDIFHLEPNTHYTVSIHSRSDNFDDPIWGDERDFVEYFVESDKLDTDGNCRARSSAEMWRRRFPYMEGVPQRTTGKGSMPIVLTSSDLCTAADSRQRISRLYSVMFTRPEVIELKNASDLPVSIRNWTLVANSGSLNVDISRITEAMQYGATARGNVCENPSIDAGGYFYIVNDATLFDYEFGSSKNGKWGTVSSEKTPVFAIDKKTLWGIHYHIKKVDAEGKWYNARSSIQVANESWAPDMLKGEFIEIVKKDTLPFRDNLHNADGIRLMITRNTRNRLFFEGVYLPVPDSANYGAGEGGEYVTTKDEFYICGLPKRGGFVSLTLKNEYDQVCARTAEYGDVTGGRGGRRNEGWSSEKVDPSHYTWKSNRTPTFGGTPRKCHNRAAPRTGVPSVVVRNRPFVSKAELMLVRKPQDWENIGDAKSVYESRNLLRSLTRATTTDGIALYANARNSHKQGWQLAGGAVASAKRGMLSAKDARWRNSTWKGHTLRFASGPMAGEAFPVADNSRKSVSVFLPGTPRGAAFRPRAGDEFVLGPGYVSPLYYTENEGEPGVWEWQVPGIDPGKTYRLSIHGLSDSIKTTEFLEENHNAGFEVKLWNFETGCFERVASRVQYNKGDQAAIAGISAPYISADSKIRMQLTPHNLQHQDSSGKAWFNYAYISPRRVQGRINVNTATKEVLSALHGVSKTLAANIANGTDRAGKRSLKPYRTVGDLLNVKGMTADAYYLICPQVTVRSASFSGEITAEVIKDTGADGTFDADAGDEVSSSESVICYFDREKNEEGPEWKVTTRRTVPR